MQEAHVSLSHRALRLNLTELIAEQRERKIKCVFFFVSLRNNNITDEGIRKLLAKGIQCDHFKKIA